MQSIQSTLHDEDVNIFVVALCWAWGLLLNMIVIVREELYGEYPTKNVTLFLMGYGAYVLMPVVVIVRMLQAPLFTGNTSVKND